MADKCEIEAVISVDGLVSIETRGLKGADCLAETAELERALGRVKERSKTREAYEKAATTKAGVRQR